MPFTHKYDTLAKAGPAFNGKAIQELQKSTIPGEGFYYSGLYIMNSDKAADFDANSLTLTADKVNYYPFRLKAEVTVTSLRFEVNVGGAAGNVVIGVYDTDENGQPYDLKITTGGVDTTTDEVKTVDTADITLEPGIYWVAINGDSAENVAAHLPANADMVLGAADAFDGTYNTGLQEDLVYSGTLPSRATISASETFVTGNVPAVGLLV